MSLFRPFERRSPVSRRPGDRRFLALAFLAAWLASGFPGPALLAQNGETETPTIGEIPPPGCANCGNYVRYGYIANDFSGWTKEVGSWAISLASPTPVQDERGNVIRASTLSQGQARIAQSFEVANALLYGPPGPQTFYVQFDVRFLSFPVGGSATPAVTLSVLRGGQQIFSQVVNKNSYPNSGNWKRLTYTGTVSGASGASNQFKLRAQVNSTDIQLDNLRFWVPNSIDRPGLCAPAPLTATGARVDQTLTLLDLEGLNYFSSRNRCNSLPGSGNPFGQDFLISNPDVTEDSTIADSHAFYTAIADELRKTTSTFYLASLSFDLPAPGSDEPDLLRTYLKPAINDLHDRFAGVPLAYRPNVQLLLSATLLPGHEHPSAEVVYAVITEDLEGPPNFMLAVAEIGKIPVDDWNHTRIAVRERRYAITGGQHWSTNYLVYHDDEDRTLHDLNLRLEGDAARSAAVQFEKLWARKLPWSCSGTAALCLEPWPAKVNQLPEQQYDPIHVFGLGRGHWTNNPGGHDLDLSADFLAYTALSTATETIRITQHQMAPLGAADLQFVVPALAEALFAGVRVEALISTPAGFGEISVEAQYLVLAGEIELLGDLWLYSQAEIRDALCRFKVAEFYAQPDGAPHRTHGKFWMVDGQTFYVGSQNLYAGAFGNYPLGDLNEFGFLVDGPQFASVVLEQYWNPVWDVSRSHQIQNAWLDCEDQDPPEVAATPDPAVLIGQPGGSAQVAVSLLNVGEQALEFDVESDDSWLVATGGGLLEPNATTQVSLSAVCPASGAPIRLGSYRVVDALSGSSKTFAVRNLCLDYALTPRPLSIGAEVGQAATGVMQLSDLAGSPFAFTVLSSDPRFGISPTFGTVGAGGSVTLHATSICPFAETTYDVAASLQIDRSGSLVNDTIRIRVHCDDDAGDSWGDPHLTTLDGYKYDFQAAGQFVFARGAFPDGSPFEVQTRQRSMSPYVAMNDGVAARVNAHRVLFRNGQVLLDGEALYLADGASQALDGGGELRREGAYHIVLWPDGASYLAVKPSHYLGFGTYYRAAVKAGPGVSDLVGLMGNGNGNQVDDLVLRNGTQLDPPLDYGELYDQFAYGLDPKGQPLGWAIRSAAESLFHPDDQMDPESLIDPEFPGSFPPPLPPLVENWAGQVCTEAGVVTPEEFAACVLDVGYSQDPSLAEGAVEAQGNGGAQQYILSCSSEWIPGWCQHLLDGIYGHCNTGEWATHGLPTAFARIVWPSPRVITGVTLWDRRCPEYVISGHLQFSDGSSVPFGTLSETGAGTTLDFTTRTASWVEIHLDQTWGDNPGLAEMLFHFQ